MTARAWTPGTGQKSERLYAWIAQEPDGGEGVIAGHLPGMTGFTPLIGADRARIESYREMAEYVARESGCPVRLKAYWGGTVIDSIEVAPTPGAAT